MKSVPLRACAVLSLAVFVGSISRAQKLPTLSSQTTVHADDVSLESYQQHLVRLESFLETCSQGHNSKSCDPALIGGDDRVTNTKNTKQHKNHKNKQQNQKQKTATKD